MVALGFFYHIICFCKSRVMVCFVRKGKIPFVLLFIFIEEMFMKVLATKQLICEDNHERNYWNTFKCVIYYLVVHAQKHTYTHSHTLFVFMSHTQIGVRCLVIYFNIFLISTFFLRILFHCLKSSWQFLRWIHKVA